MRQVQDTTPIVSGANRFDHFREQLRLDGVNLSCEEQVGNLEIWRAIGRAGQTRFIVIVGKDGFSLFHESQTIGIADDVAEILRRVA